MTFNILLIYMLSFLLSRLSFWFYGQRTQISELIFLFLFSFWVFNLIKRKKIPNDTGLNKPFLVFLVFCLISFFNSFNLFLSTAELIGLIYLFVMLILVVDVVDSRKKIDTIIKFWIGGLVFVLILGFMGLIVSIATGQKNIFCWVYQGNFPYIKTAYRTTSIFHNPLALANYLIVSLGLVFSELFLTDNRRYKIFLKITIFSLCLIMFTTVSREILSLILYLFLIYNHFYKENNLKFKSIRFLLIIFISTIFLLSIIFCSIFHIVPVTKGNLYNQNYKKLTSNLDYAYREKLAYKIAALEMFKRHPFLGVGLKMYRPYLKKLNNENYFYLKNFIPIYSYGKSSEYLDYLPVNDPHNDVLQYFAETGILGGSAFIFFIVTFLYLVATNLKKTDDHYFKTRLFCFFAAFIGVLIESIDIDVFKLRPVWFLMAITLALIMIENYQTKSKTKI